MTDTPEDGCPVSGLTMSREGMQVLVADAVKKATAGRELATLQKTISDNTGRWAFAHAEGENTHAQEGMSLRAYLASQALQGELASQGENWGGEWPASSAPELAKRCRVFADALIAELPKEAP